MNKFNICDNPTVCIHGYRIPEGAIYGHDEKLGYWVCSDFRLHKGCYNIHVLSDACIIAYQKERIEDAPHDGKHHRHIQRYKYLLDLWQGKRVGRKSDIGKGITNIITKYKPTVIPHIKADLPKNNRASFQETRPKHDFVHAIPDGRNSGRTFKKSYVVNDSDSIWRTV